MTASPWMKWPSIPVVSDAFFAGIQVSIMCRAPGHSVVICEMCTHSSCLTPESLVTSQGSNDEDLLGGRRGGRGGGSETEASHKDEKGKRGVYTINVPVLLCRVDR